MLDQYTIYSLPQILIAHSCLGSYTVVYTPRVVYTQRLLNHAVFLLTVPGGVYAGYTYKGQSTCVQVCVPESAFVLISLAFEGSLMKMVDFAQATALVQVDFFSSMC